MTAWVELASGSRHIGQTEVSCFSAIERGAFRLRLSKRVSVLTVDSGLSCEFSPPRNVMKRECSKPKVNTKTRKTTRKVAATTIAAETRSVGVSVTCGPDGRNVER